jgi:Tfp pilus assembly protein PilN
MNDQAMTFQDLYRMLSMLGAALLGINALMMGATVFLSGRRTSRADDREEGARRAEMQNLVELARENKLRWDRHDEFVNQRLDELRKTQETLNRLADAHQNTRGDVDELRRDVKDAVQAARAASDAITRLATGIVVSARIGLPVQQPGDQGSA